MIAMTYPSYRFLVCGLALFIAGEPRVAEAADNSWPHWRGPNRNDVVGEVSGWEAGAWAPQKPAWTTDVGEGSTSPVVVDGRLYTMGWQNGQDRLVCLDARTGKRLWRVSYKCPRYGRHATGDQGLYSGPTSTPEYNRQTGYLYTLSVDGDLNCWDTNAKGRSVWKLNLYEAYHVPRRSRVNRSGRRDYGYTSSPLVHDDWVIVEVGAPVGNLIAFDKRTGQQQWTSEANDPAGHNGGPVPIIVDGTPCIAVHTFNGLLVARLDVGHQGETVATYPWKTHFANNIATPAVHGNNVVMTSSYNHHKIVRLRITLNGGATKVWERNEASKVCSPVIYDGYLYWAWRTMTCLDFETGKIQWQGGRFSDAGSCIATADNRLIVWANRGDLYLVESARRSPKEYTELASRKRLGRSDAWPHIVLADGRLYCKDRTGYLICFDLD